ncbi:hypothetical protein BDW69DRAFT_176606 [Aspergillus filifer]
MDALVQACSAHAIGTRDEESRLCDFLRYITEVIIHHKDRLPEDVRLSLSETFKIGRKSSSTQHTGHRASGARSRISVVRNVSPSPELLSAISKFNNSPFDFWTDGLDLKVDWANKNALRRVYQRNRRNDMANAIYRAFDTTLTYLLIGKICKAFGVVILTPAVSEYCITVILGQGGNDQERNIVKEDLKQDFNAGKRWNTYARKLGGYGAFFLLGVVPSWM